MSYTKRHLEKLGFRSLSELQPDSIDDSYWFDKSLALPSEEFYALEKLPEELNEREHVDRITYTKS